MHPEDITHYAALSSPWITGSHHAGHARPIPLSAGTDTAVNPIEGMLF